MASRLISTCRRAAHAAYINTPRMNAGLRQRRRRMWSIIRVLQSRSELRPVICPHAQRVQDRGHAVHVSRPGYLHEFLPRVRAGVRLDLLRGVQHVQLQQVVVVRAPERAVPQHPLERVLDARQVVTLEHAFHVEPLRLHVLHEVLC